MQTGSRINIIDPDYQLFFRNTQGRVLRDLRQTGINLVNVKVRDTIGHRPKIAVVPTSAVELRRKEPYDPHAV